MIDALIQRAVQCLIAFPPEVASFLALIVALATLCVFHRVGGLSGLYLYNALVICLANVQLLHVTHYVFWPDPLPLGTVLFTTMFLSDALIVDRYGAKAAQKGITLNVLAYVFFAGSMLVTLMHAPAQVSLGSADPFLQEACENYQAMTRLFTPSARFFMASCLASFISQSCLVQIFSRIKVKNNNICINQFISTFSASLIDHLIFTFIAFYLLADTRPSLDLFWGGYVVGSFVLRIIIILSFILIHKWLVRFKSLKEKV